MYKVEDFYERIKSCEHIVCFGAGKLLKHFINTYKSSVALDKVLACIDNNASLHGTYVEMENRSIPICSIDFLMTLNMHNTFVLITCARPIDIIRQLKNLECENEIEYYCYSIIKNITEEENALKKVIPKNIKLVSDAIIPKKIHYCWFGRNPIPDKYKYWMESWHKYCPDYEIIEWNEDNYNISKNSYMLQAYEAKKWGFVPDYARLDIIYQHGGIYLDTDVELVKNLDDLLYQKGFAGFECDERVALGLGFGATKNLSIIKRMRDYYDDLQFVNPDGSYNLIASPRIQTEMLLKEGLKLNGEYQILDGLTIFPEKVFCGKGLNTRQIRITEDTRSIHHYDASWVNQGAKENLQRLVQEMQKDIKRV